MIPGMNPRQMQHMMRQLGMSQEDVDATEVIIKTSEGDYVFKNPNVQKVTMQGQITFQVIGDFEVEESKVDIKIEEDDINTVSEQAGVSKEDARKALEDSKGDIAQAIINLSS